MRALVARGPEDWSIDDVPDPAQASGGVLVAVEAAGVCAADRMLWTGLHPWGEIGWPIVPGHELLGRVTASDRDDVPVGQRVTAEVKVPCGTCAPCTAGRPNLCLVGPHLGSGFAGAFAQQVSLPAGALVHAVPEDLPTATAVLAEPMACAVHAVRRGGVVAGESVLVVGLGPLGALTVVAASRSGADVLVATRDDAKYGLVQDLGASWFDPAGGVPPDVVLEVSGTQAGLATALAAVRPGGRVVVYGVHPGPVMVDVNRIGELGELDVRGGHLAPGAFGRAIELLADPRVAAVTTDRLPLERFAEALAPAASDRSSALAGPRLKVVLHP